MTDGGVWSDGSANPPHSGLYERRRVDGSVVVDEWNGSNWSDLSGKDWSGSFAPQSGLPWRLLPPRPRDVEGSRRGPVPPPPNYPPTAESLTLIAASSAFFSRPVP